MTPKMHEELDTMVCTAPGCGCGGELFLRAKCHPHDPLDVSYVAGVVHVACRKCKKPVVDIAVASADAQRDAFTAGYRCVWADDGFGTGGKFVFDSSVRGSVHQAQVAYAAWQQTKEL